jgi:hypothetical protein
MSKGLKIVSIVVSIIGGILAIFFGFSMLMICNLGWIGPSFCLYQAIIGGIGLLSIIGALIELKSLLAGSLICGITGVLGIILAVMITMILTYPTLYLVIFFFNIIGGALGILDYLVKS